MKPYKKLPLTLHELVAYDHEQPSCLRIIGVVEAWLTAKRAELHKEFAHG